MDLNKFYNMKRSLIFLLGVLFTVLLSYYLRKSYPIEDPSYASNIVVEFHGLIFDLIFFGFLLSIYETLSSKKIQISRWKEELDDYRYWNESLASRRIYGIVRRLNNAKVYSVDLSNCLLKELKVESLRINFNRRFKYVKLRKLKKVSNLVVFETKLVGSFAFVNITNSQFRLSLGSKVFFTECEFYRTNFQLIYSSDQVVNVIFENCKFTDCMFGWDEDCDLSLINQFVFIHCVTDNCDFLDENGNYNKLPIS